MSFFAFSSLFFKCLLMIFLSAFSLKTLAQGTHFKSSVDEDLTIKKITLAPVFDNVKNIYAKPLGEHLNKILADDRQWAETPWPQTLKLMPDDLETKPENVKLAQKAAAVDSVLALRITRGPNGISMKLNLFSGGQGLLLAQEILQDYDAFEINALKAQLESMYKKLKAKVPYRATILSRKGQLVTLDMGIEDGLKEGDELSVVQIIKLQRHPKFKFVIGTDKEILGRIKVTKSDDYLSFATLLLEREPNSVVAGMKLIPIDFVKYNETPIDGMGKMQTPLNDRQDGPVAFGDNPKEWRPMPAPTFGKIGILAGLGSYSVNNTLDSGYAVNGSNNLVPSIHLEGELWLTPNWFAELNLRQYVFSIPNSYPSASTPEKISISTLETSLQGGYNFLLEDQFWGPKFQFLIGYSQMKSTVDTSTPTAYTSLSFGGLALGVAGSMPLSDDSLYSMGARMMYYLSPTVDESPVTSGSSSSAKITSFSVFGNYRYQPNFQIKGELLYDLYSASFSGVGTRANTASSASHTLATLAFGIEYLF